VWWSEEEQASLCTRPAEMSRYFVVETCDASAVSGIDSYTKEGSIGISVSSQPFFIFSYLSWLKALLAIVGC